MQLGGFLLEPQAQLVYEHQSLDDTADGGALVHYDETGVWRGRIGARLVKRFAFGEETAPRLLTTWGRVNLWHDFGGHSDMTISNLYGRHPERLKIDDGKTWTQLELGLSGQITDNASLLASGDYNVSLDGGDTHSFGGRIGLKFVW